MKWQFYRLAGTLFLSCLLLFWSFGELVDAYDAQQDSYTLSASQLFAEQQPTRELITSEQLQLPPEVLQELTNGHIVALQSANADWFYYKNSPEQGLLWRFGPFTAPADENNTRIYILLLFYACLMLAAAAMLYPLFRDLQHLQHKAGLFMANPKQMEPSIPKHSPIYPLARDFVDAGNQLVRWYELHQFLSRAISHDVRTPLSRMRFALELCQDEMPSPYWQRLETDIQQIEQLVNNYLNFARLEQLRQPTTKQYIELSVFASQVQQQFNWRPSEISLQFEVGEGFVWLEPFSLEIVWQNLLSNAFRFAAKEVRCSFFTNGDTLKLLVEDDGPGFDSQVNIQAFEPQSAPSATGFGLGLYIIKQVVGWHAGTFTISRSPSLGGALVQIELPLTN